MTMRTLLENFDGFSQILKKQSGQKGIFTVDVLTYPIAIILKYENLRIYRKNRVSE